MVKKQNLVWETWPMLIKMGCPVLPILYLKVWSAKCPMKHTNLLAQSSVQQWEDWLREEISCTVCDCMYVCVLCITYFLLHNTTHDWWCGLDMFDVMTEEAGNAKRKMNNSEDRGRPDSDWLAHVVNLSSIYLLVQKSPIPHFNTMVQTLGLSHAG